MSVEEASYEEAFYILLVLALVVICLILLVVGIKRCRSGSKSSLILEFLKELGYRKNCKGNSSYKNSTQLTPWRTSVGWNSRSLNYNRHTISRPPSVVITVCQETSVAPIHDVINNQQNFDQGMFLQVPMTIIEEEEEPQLEDESYRAKK